MQSGKGDRTRWWALLVLCMGVLMIVLDTTVVNVALPSIRAQLHFSETSLVWVMNAYLLTFGGFLLLGGRLGDLFGHRRLFLSGVALFTLASLGCGLADSQGVLIVARAIQGVAGAVVSAVALSLIMNLFVEHEERAKAMGIYGFVCSAGGSLGLLLGGVLTSSLNWHWVFLINVPIGIVVCVWVPRLLGKGSRPDSSPTLDIAGATTVTTSLTLAVYAVVNGNETGWTSARTLGLLACAVVLFASFLLIESRARAPLMPLGLFRLRSLVGANIAATLWAAAMFAWFFISTLYLQLVLGAGPMQVGFAFLPANLIMAVFSLGLSAKLVVRFGVKRPLAAGLLFAAAGLACFARAPVGGSILPDVVPGMMLLGVGAGMAFNPLLLAAMSGVPARDSGLASGLVNTSFMMGGALGLAVLASLAAARTGAMLREGSVRVTALSSGYHVAFAAGLICALAAGALAVILIPAEPPLPRRQGERVPAAGAPMSAAEGE